MATAKRASAKAKGIPLPMTGVSENLGIHSTRVVWVSRPITGGGRFVVGDARYYRLVRRVSPSRTSRRGGRGRA
jgi:hypothetical protein